MMNRSHRLKHLATTICVTLLSFLLFATTTVSVGQASAFALATSTVLPPMSLVLVAANGTQLILNSSDISSLPSYRAYGGFVNQLGNLKSLGNYTGVPLIALCNLVGGLGNGSNLLVTASDAYNMTLSYEQVNGNWTTYDNVTGQPTRQTEPLTPILAYYYDDANLSSADGPLRLAIVGPEGLLTNSSFWVKSVIKIEILITAVPELSVPCIILVFMIATTMTALVFRKKFGTRGPSHR